VVASRSQRNDLCMGRDVQKPFRIVMATRNDPAFTHNDSTYRDFPCLSGLLCRFERFPHEKFIVQHLTSLFSEDSIFLATDFSFPSRFIYLCTWKIKIHITAASS
jgi:hypothetical protein